MKLNTDTEGLKNIGGVFLPFYDTHFEKYLHCKMQYQSESVQAALDYVTVFDTFVDVGAHVGLITRQLAGHFRHGIAIEPQRGAVLKSLKLNCPDNVEILNIAVADKKGKIALHGLERENSGGVVPVVDEFKGVFNDIQAITLDSALRGPKITSLRKPLVQDVGDIGLIKIDVEGFELRVIKGGMVTIMKHRPVLLLENPIKKGNKESPALREDPTNILTDNLNYKFIKKVGKDLLFVPKESPKLIKKKKNKEKK